jgi:hypothetical protein
MNRPSHVCMHGCVISVMVRCCQRDIQRFGRWRPSKLLQLFLASTPRILESWDRWWKGSKIKTSEPQYIHLWFKGSTFLQVFFKALKNIADECKGFTADSPIWDHHYHGLGRNKEIVPPPIYSICQEVKWQFCYYCSISRNQECISRAISI